MALLILAVFTDSWSRMVSATVTGKTQLQSVCLFLHQLNPSKFLGKSRSQREQAECTFSSFCMNQICGLPTGYSKSLGTHHQGMEQIMPPTVGGHCKVTWQKNEESESSSQSTTNFCPLQTASFLTDYWGLQERNSLHSVSHLFISRDEY